MFQSVNDVIAGFGAQKYICNNNVATVVYLGTALQKPILVEGPAGVGKTELGKVLADALDMELIRLQCYEGLDEAKALYEWEYAKQLLYTQILKDKIGEITKGSETLQDAVNSIASREGVSQRAQHDDTCAFAEIGAVRVRAEREASSRE